MMKAELLLLVGVAAWAVEGLKPPPLAGPVRESALPLAGRRFLLLPPRAEAPSALAAALVSAGGRPVWAPVVRVEPLEDYTTLDDRLMRLAEYDVLVTLSAPAIDTLASRWLGLADGNEELMRLMIDASSVEIGAIGAEAARFRELLGVPPSVVPIESSTRALANTLADLGHVPPGARVLIACAEAELPLADPPASVGALMEEISALGGETERAITHTIVPAAPDALSAELSLLRAGQIDGIVAWSAEEVSHLRALLGEGEWPREAPPLVVAVGADVAAAARQARIVTGEDGAAEGEASQLLTLGDRADEDDIVAALEAHFGAGRLLF